MASFPTPLSERPMTRPARPFLRRCRPPRDVPRRHPRRIRSTLIPASTAAASRPKLRHIKYTQVVSYLIGSYKTNIWGVFCEECASKRLTKASLVTGAFGWMSVPGLFYSAHALGRNLTGGQQQNLINLEICTRQAVYYFSRGDRANARIAATDAQAFAGGVNEGWWNDDEKRRARELIPIIQEVLAKA